MRLTPVVISLFLFFQTAAQTTPTISVAEVSRIEKTLAADNMQGRKVFTPGVEKAAAFIEQEFRKAGLKPLPGSLNFRQRFTMVDPLSTSVTVNLDGSNLPADHAVVLSGDSSFDVTPSSNYQKIIIKKGMNYKSIEYKYLNADRNTLIIVDTSFARYFARLARFHMAQFAGTANRIFLLTSQDPQQYFIHVRQNLKKQDLSNIAGMIPGKSKPGEYVVFSAHYDHLGIGRPDASGDSLYNGANDDASGTTAVITLAQHFSKLKNNQRTLIFVAFTAEEIGEFGSEYFSDQINPDKVVAMLNVEMIGTESKWGLNSAYVTGYDKSDLGAILMKNLSGSPFKFYPDPYPQQMLFLRSDNATLARKGVPAHTISTSKMDAEKLYHTPGDSFESLDMKNMTEIIRAIAISSGSIVSGKDTPRRVQPETAF